MGVGEEHKKKWGPKFPKILAYQNILPSQNFPSFLNFPSCLKKYIKSG